MKDGKELDLGYGNITVCGSFKYLGVTFSRYERMTWVQESNDKRIINQANTVLCSDKLIEEMKTIMYK